MKRVITGLAVAAVMVLSASDCGSSGDGNPIEDEAAADETTEAGETTEATEPAAPATPDVEGEDDEVDDVTIAQMIATGATVEELAEAQAWLANDEPMMN